MCFCCGGTICKICTLLILVVVLIGFLFGFGVFKHGFHKLKDTLHEDIYSSATGRPFIGYPAPGPF